MRKKKNPEMMFFKHCKNKTFKKSIEHCSDPSLECTCVSTWRKCQYPNLYLIVHYLEIRWHPFISLFWYPFLLRSHPLGLFIIRNNVNVYRMYGFKDSVSCIFLFFFGLNWIWKTNKIWIYMTLTWAFCRILTENSC